MKEFVEKLPYLAPRVKVVPFKVERGFETSDTQLSTSYYKMSQSQLDEERMVLEMLGQNGHAKNNTCRFGETTDSYWGGTGGEGVGFWQ